jgi:hypothetical protein
VGRRTILLSLMAVVLVAGLAAGGTWLLTRGSDETDGQVASRPSATPTPTPAPAASPTLGCPEAKAESRRLEIAGRRLQAEGDAFPTERHSAAEAQEFTDRLDRHIQLYTDLVTAQSACFGSETVARVLAALERLHSDNLY